MKMDLVLKGVELSPLAEDRVTRRAEKLVARLDHEPTVRVALATEHNVYGAHVRLVSSGREIVGTSQSRDNILTAFDDAIAKAERQLSRSHTRQDRRDSLLHHVA